VSVGAAGAAKGHLWLFAIVAGAFAGVGYLAIKGPGGFGAKGSAGAPKDPVAAAAARGKNIQKLQAAQQALQSGDTKEAYNQANAVLEQEPKNPRAREVMGDTLVKGGNAAQGVKEYEVALAIEPTGARHYKIGKALVSANDAQAAAKHLMAAIKMAPGAAWAEEVQGLLIDLGGGQPNDGGAAGAPGGAGGPEAPSGAADGAP
jgi:tetratricopeptide (TPR) repeat protein